MTNRELAAQIIQQAEEAAERKFQQTVNETLPRELTKYPKDEHREYYRRKLQKFREWQFNHYSLPFDVEKHTPEQLAAWLKALLDDRDRGLKARGIGSNQAAVDMLRERFFAVRYIRYLVGLLDGTPEATTPKAPAQPAAELGEELAQVVREALEARGLMEGGKFTGSTTQAKALYNVLQAKGYLKGTYPAQRFAAFLLQYFGSRITYRTFQNPPNRGQKKEEQNFENLIPDA